MLKLIPLTAVRREAVFCLNHKRELIVHCGKKANRYVYVASLSNISMFRHMPAGLHLKDAELIRVYYVLYKYALRIGDSRELRKLTCLPKDILPTMREVMFSSREMVAYKLATLNCLMHNYLPERHLDKVQAVFKLFGLTKDDAVLYALLFHNGDLSTLLSELAETTEGLDLSFSGLQKEVSAPLVQQKIRRYAISFAYRKLRFVYEGNRMTIEDMIGELTVRAIQAYYWVRPYYTKEHALNYALRSMGKHALNIIRHYTDPSRARVVAENGGYTNVVQEFGPLDPSDGSTEDAMILYIDFKRGKVEAA